MWPGSGPSYAPAASPTASGSSLKQFCTDRSARLCSRSHMRRGVEMSGITKFLKGRPHSGQQARLGVLATLGPPPQGTGRGPRMWQARPFFIVFVRWPT